jgi:hypothetical protein
MNRTQALVISTVLLLIFAIIYHIWAGWGLITIHAKGMPLGKVIASMERQGRANIQTDMSLDTPVTMNVDKVHLNYALEVLSTVTDSRWRLLFFAAGDKATLDIGEKAWFAGQQPTDWKMLSFPMGNLVPLTDDSADSVPPDPRTDAWTPKTTAPNPLQTFFAEAAMATNAGFAFPTDWNPTVDKAPSAGVVQHVLPKLISDARGHDDEIFFLSQNGRRPGGQAGGPGPGSDLQFDPDLLAERVQSQIDRLPPEQKADAQSNFDVQEAFRKSLQGMTDDERRAAWMAHMQDPVIQQMIQNRQDGRDAMMNHDQRVQRFSNYVNRKMSITGKL